MKNASQMKFSVQTYQSQRGVALLTILFMVVIASLLAMSILNRQERMVREAGVMLRQDQAWLYAKSGEYFLSELLVSDAKTSKANDNLSEQWARPLPAFPVEDGTVTGHLSDEQSRFNLNNLYHDGQPDKEAIEFLKRLLKRVGLAPELAESVLDWQDPDDQVTGAMGAEDSFYLGQQNGYLAANRPFTQIEELKQVRGFDAKSYQLIAPYISALPYFAPVNVNTTSGVVLSAISDELQPAQLQDWVAQRDKNQKYVNQVTDLWTQPQFNIPADKKPTGIDKLLSVKSDFFEAKILVSMSGRKRYLTSDLYRQGEQVMCYQRHQMPIADFANNAPAINELLKQLGAN